MRDGFLKKLFGIEIRKYESFSKIAILDKSLDSVLLAVVFLGVLCIACVRVFYYVGKRKQLGLPVQFLLQMRSNTVSFLPFSRLLCRLFLY